MRSARCTSTSGLVVACRRIVERHPFTGPLWWLCANVSTSAEPFEAVWELADEIRNDPTGAELAAVIPDEALVVTIGDPDVIGSGLIRRGDISVVALDAGHTATSFVRRMERCDVDVEPVDAGVAGVVCHHADVVLVEAMAVDSGRAVVPVGSSTIAAAASTWGTPVWLVAGVGRRLAGGVRGRDGRQGGVAEPGVRSLGPGRRGTPRLDVHARGRPARQGPDGSARHRRRVPPSLRTPPPQPHLILTPSPFRLRRDPGEACLRIRAANVGGGVDQAEAGIGPPGVSRARSVERTHPGRCVTSFHVYSKTRSPRSWSSLRRWASRARSAGLAWPFWPDTSTTTRAASNRKSTRATCCPPASNTTWVRGLGSPASRASSRNRRSRIVWPPESVIMPSTSRHPHRPEPRRSDSRRASTSGADSCSRTALSIAASIRRGWARARARSKMVRVADVTRNPSTTTWSTGESVSWNGPRTGPRVAVGRGRR